MAFIGSESLWQASLTAGAVGLYLHDLFPFFRLTSPSRRQALQARQNDLEAPVASKTLHQGYRTPARRSPPTAL